MLTPSRRAVLLGATAAATAASLPLATRAQPATPHDAAIAQGLDYFRQQAETQQRLCADLTQAIASGDLDQAEWAYEVARPPYEQIEVHAWAFEDIDAAIDARPYAFDGGEGSDAFRGFHRIEALIYRDRDLASALPYAHALEASVAELAVALSEPARFTPEGFMQGMLALSEEVAAKKISSEEETWSDLSMIIFRHNFIGIQSQFMGFAPALSAQDSRLLDNALMAFGSAQSVLDPFFEGPRVIRYSDVRARERAAIARAAYDIRDAVHRSAEALDLI